MLFSAITVTLFLTVQYDDGKLKYSANTNHN